MARVGFGDRQGIYFRIHCLELLDCNECDHYAKRVIDTELLSAQCGSRDPGLADCIARCGTLDLVGERGDNKLPRQQQIIGVEFTSLPRPQQQLCSHAQKKVPGGGPLALIYVGFPAAYMSFRALDLLPQCFPAKPFTTLGVDELCTKLCDICINGCIVLLRPNSNTCKCR